MTIDRKLSTLRNASHLIFLECIYTPQSTRTFRVSNYPQYAPDIINPETELAAGDVNSSKRTTYITSSKTVQNVHGSQTFGAHTNFLQICEFTC